MLIVFFFWSPYDVLVRVLLFFTIRRDSLEQRFFFSNENFGIFDFPISLTHRRGRTPCPYVIRFILHLHPTFIFIRDSLEKR